MDNWQNMVRDLFSQKDEKRNRAKFFFLSIGYDTMCDLIPGRPYEKFAELIASGRPSRVLDYCSGTGYTARNLAKLLPQSRIDALDISPEMLAVARERSLSQSLTNIHFYEESAAELPFESDSFDTVCCSLGLHELPTGIRNAALNETLRVLKPGGAFFAMDLDRPDNLGLITDFYMAIGEPPYAREILSDRIKILIKEKGFTEIHKSTHVAGFFQFVSARKP